MDLLLELDKAVKRGPQPGQLGLSFDESEHPREPAGSAKGGEFKKKEGGDPNVLHTFTDADGVKAVVARNTGKGGAFIVSYHDSDNDDGTAGKSLGSYTWATEETAIKDAKRFVGYREPGLPQPRDMTTLSAAELKTIYRDANAWQYLRMKHDAGYPWADSAEHVEYGKRNSKSHLDQWLMDRHNITDATAHRVANDLDAGKTWAVVGGYGLKNPVAWQGGDPVPTYEEFPDAVPERIGATDWAKAPDTSANVLHTFTNEEDGVKSVVARNTGAGGGFIVSLHDLDAGESVGISKIHTTEEAAIKDAKELVHLPEDADEGGGGSLGANSASGRSKEALIPATRLNKLMTANLMKSDPREVDRLWDTKLSHKAQDEIFGVLVAEGVRGKPTVKKVWDNLTPETQEELRAGYYANLPREGEEEDRQDTEEGGGASSDDNSASGRSKTALTPADQPAWKMSASGYLSAHNVHEPWIAEIAPHQMGMLSERQKAKYHEKRAEEWGTAGQAKQEWRNAIMAAYDRGEITKGTEGLHPEAKSAIFHALKAREEEAVKGRAAEIGRTNDIRSADQVNVGDRVWDRASMQYGRVTDKKRGRLFIQPEATTGYASKPFSAMFGRFQRLSSSDVDQAAKATKKSLVLVLEKATRRPTVPSGQLGFGFDESAHPRIAAGSHEGGHHGGEFSKKKEPALMLGTSTKKPHGEPTRTGRTDVHRPAEMVPEDYNYLATSFPVDTHSGTKTMWSGDSEWEKLGEPKQGTAEHSQVGKCDHCGAHHKYQVILQHKGTGDLVSVGHQCYENRFSVPGWNHTVADMARRAEVAAKRQQNVAKGRAAMSDEEREAHTWATGSNAHPIAADMARKLAEFGSLSSKQKEFMLKLHKEHLDKQVANDEGTQKVAPVPSGKHTVRGVVLSVRFVENNFGGQTKMLVQDERGWKVWGTRPAALGDAEKGAEVEFSGDLEPSKDDEGFGFFSRPSKARYTNKPEVSGPDAKEIQRISEAAANEYPGGEWSPANIQAALKDFDGDVRLAMFSLLNHFGMGREARRDYPDLAPNALAKAVDRDPMLLLKAKAQPGQLGFGFDEEKHPREPAGSAKGGEFSKKPEPEYKGGAEIAATKEPAKRGLFGGGVMGYKEAVATNLKHMGTAASEWTSLPIEGMVEGDDDGKSKMMPMFDFKSVAGYADAPTLFPQDANTCCELCGHQIKNVYWLKNDTKQWTLKVGSECVTNFMEGKSGAELTKEAKWEINRDLLRQALDARRGIWTRYTVSVHQGYGRMKSEFPWGAKKAAAVYERLFKLTKDMYADKTQVSPFRTDDAQVTRWANKNKAELDELLTEAGYLLAEQEAAKPAHEALGGHMASHVPVGTAQAATEAPTPTQEFRMSKSMSLVLTLERSQPIAPR